MRTEHDWLNGRWEPTPGEKWRAVYYIPPPHNPDHASLNPTRAPELAGYVGQTSGEFAGPWIEEILEFDADAASVHNPR